MFDKRKYYNYSSILENLSIVSFIVYCCICATIGLYFLEIKGVFIGLLAGFLTGYLPYMFAQIKVQDMRMKLEIHNSITKK